MPDIQSRYWLNGKALHPSVLAQDRGLQYGDGVFRTLAVYEGKPVDLDGQLALLAHDAQRLHIQFSRNQLAQECRELASGADAASMKIIVTRGYSQRGYAPPATCEPNRWVSLAAVPARIGALAAQGIALRLNPIRLGHTPHLAGIKHLNRLEQVLARRAHQGNASDEGLMLDSHERVISGIQSNLFFCRNGKLHTPALAYSGVAGRMRQRLLALAQNAGMVPQTGDYQMGDLLRAEELFICNSLIGIRPVNAIDEQAFEIGPVTRKLQNLLDHPVLS